MTDHFDKYSPLSSDSCSPANENFSEVDEAEELDRIVLEEHGGGSLEKMHERSRAIRVVRDRLLNSTYSVDRQNVILWLVGQFEEAHLKDEWLVATISLLDRVLAGPQASILKLRRRSSAEQDPMAVVLAVVLSVLKMSTSDEELGMTVREAIFRIARRKQPVKLWQQIIEAEFKMCMKLDFRVGVPSYGELLSRVMLDIVAAAKGSLNTDSWPGLKREKVQPANEKASTPRVVALSYFLLELGLVHVHKDVYHEEQPPIVFVFAIARLALTAFGQPPAACVKVLKVAESQLLGAEEAERLISPLVGSLHRCWKEPPADSQLISKWKLRELLDSVHLPVAPDSVVPLADPIDVLMCTPPKPSRRQSPPPTSAPRLPRPESEKRIISGDASASADTETMKMETSSDSIPSRVGLRRVKGVESAESSSSPAVVAKGKRPLKSQGSSASEGKQRKLAPAPEVQKRQRLKRLCEVEKKR